MRPTEAPSQLDWPELLDLAEALGVSVYKPDAHGHIVEVVEPPTTETRQQKEIP
jgi:hypothetical protein